MHYKRGNFLTGGENNTVPKRAHAWNWSDIWLILGILLHALPRVKDVKMCIAGGGDETCRRAVPAVFRWSLHLASYWSYVLDVNYRQTWRPNRGGREGRNTCFWRALLCRIEQLLVSGLTSEWENKLNSTSCRSENNEWNDLVWENFFNPRPKYKPTFGKKRLQTKSWLSLSVFK